MSGFNFKVKHELSNGSLARTGVIQTPQGEIQTPAFIVVGTKATVKALTPEQIKAVHAQAVLANAYHLYLQPGSEVIEAAGGLAKFMGWDGPTFTDSGGFQVLSLGSGYKKVLAMQSGVVPAEDAIAPMKERRAFVDNDGVTFKSHLDGSTHRFTPELSIEIQSAIGADIIFAFDELTSLVDPYEYQVEALARTHSWAERCLKEIARLRTKKPKRPYQALYGVIQGAQYEDLRRQAGRFMGSLPFDGYGIGGAIEKSRLGEIVRWVNEELPDSTPKHLLGISEPDDIFMSIENGIDTFDCVSPTRVARNGAAYTYEGRTNIVASRYRSDLGPIDKDCSCYSCTNFSRSYMHHLLHAKELLANTLMTIHNTHFIVGLVDDIRTSIEGGTYESFKRDWLKRYYR